MSSNAVVCENPILHYAKMRNNKYNNKVTGQSILMSFHLIITLHTAFYMLFPPSTLRFMRAASNSSNLDLLAASMAASSWSMADWICGEGGGGIIGKLMKQKTQNQLCCLTTHKG